MFISGNSSRLLCTQGRILVSARVMATRAAFAPSAGRVRPKPRRVPTRAASDRADGGGGGAPRVEPSFQRSVPPGDAREREIAIETWVSAPVASRRACDRGEVDDGGVG